MLRFIKELAMNGWSRTQVLAVVVVASAVSIVWWKLVGRDVLSVGAGVFLIAWPVLWLLMTRRYQRDGLSASADALVVACMVAAGYFLLAHPPLLPFFF